MEGVGQVLGDVANDDLAVAILIAALGERGDRQDQQQNQCQRDELLHVGFLLIMFITTGIARAIP